MRLFIGIALDDALRVQLRWEAEALRAHMRGNFSLPANYHVTLAFLGQHEESEIPAIRAAIDAASARCQFDIGIGGLGSFKNGNRQIVWAGVNHSNELCDMQRRMCAELRARGISFNDEGAYRPHITLARQCEILPLPGGTVNYRQRVRAVTLFESARREGELRYTPLEKAALRA